MDLFYFNCIWKFMPSLQFASSFSSFRNAKRATRGSWKIRIFRKRLFGVFSSRNKITFGFCFALQTCTLERIDAYLNLQVALAWLIKWKEIFLKKNYSNPFLPIFGIKFHFSAELWPKNFLRLLYSKSVHSELSIDPLFVYFWGHWKVEKITIFTLSTIYMHFCDFRRLKFWVKIFVRGDYNISKWCTKHGESKYVSKRPVIKIWNSGGGPLKRPVLNCTQAP